MYKLLYLSGPNSYYLNIIGPTPTGLFRWLLNEVLFILLNILLIRDIFSLK